MQASTEPLKSYDQHTEYQSYPLDMITRQDELPTLHRPQPYRVPISSSTELVRHGSHGHRHQPTQSAGVLAVEWDYVRSLQRFLPDTKWTIILTLIILFQGILSVTLGRMVDGAYSDLWNGGIDRNDQSETQNPIVTLVDGQFYTIVIESSYLVLLCLDCVHKRNIVEAIGICLNSLSMLFLVGIGMYSSMGVSYDTLVRWPYIELLVVLAVGLICASYATWKLSHEFAWHIADADRSLRKRYLIYEAYIALLHLDFFFMLGFWIQAFLLAFPFYDQRSYSPNAAFIAMSELVGTPLQLVLGLVSVRYELRIGQCLTMAVCMVNVGLIGPEISSYYSFGGLDAESKRTALLLGKRTIAYASIGAPLLLITIVMAVVCLRNFDKGIKPIVTRRKACHCNSLGDSYVDCSQYPSMQPPRARMEID
ncbi:hypothetical protein LTR56_002008 [Elasticomyces elasticus]|nr:hypothetical protein LTR22_011593 [Elasticomyces elasticus]KAK3658152.1 hypothetical protein LTR56_002008 [Elasticomyces elasticus]KAK5764037.1 hypothetical protein LTS12_005730 [Elasticomyces elasticus]